MLIEIKESITNHSSGWLTAPADFRRWGDRMINLKTVSIILVLVASVPLLASEAPRDMRQFNVTCPASKLLPFLDANYHECSNGFVNGSCEMFVDIFRELLPEYDCQRTCDSSPTKNYIVPAIWLAGDAALRDYIHLLWRMSSSKDKVFTKEDFYRTTEEAKRLFGSKEFRNILDGHLGETYRPLSIKVENELKRRGNLTPQPPAPPDRQ
jgi:hypothetical protein